MWTKEFIDTVVRKYLLGAPIYTIANTLGTGDPEEIEEVINMFLRSEGIID